MPRNNDGTVTRLRDYEKDDANNAEFNGKILNDDFEDNRRTVEDCLDRRGRGQVLSSISWGNNRLLDLANPKDLQDAVNFQTLLDIINNGFKLTDNGSISSSGLVKLKSTVTDLKVDVGFKFSFVAPFTFSADSIVAKGGYETIEIETTSGKVSYNVLRAPFVKDDSYPNGIKDNRPSFLKDQVCTMELVDINNNRYFRQVDGHFSGEIITYHSTSITPSGYVDLSYGYDGYPNTSFYRFLASYNPIKGGGVLFNSYKKAMLPDHFHGATGYGQTLDYPKVEWAPAIATTYRTYFPRLGNEKGEGGIDGNKVEKGDDLYPSHLTTRFLEKI